MNSNIKDYVSKLNIFNATNDRLELIYPQRFAGTLEMGAFQVTKFITYQTTPSEFDQYVSTIAGYQLWHGGRCEYTALQAALEDQNWPLAKHIATLGGERVVNLIGNGGVFPLLQVRNIEIAQCLIENGAIINGAVEWKRQYSTAISCAIERKDYKVAAFLYKNGAVIGPNQLNIEEFFKHLKMTDNDEVTGSSMLD